MKNPLVNNKELKRDLVVLIIIILLPFTFYLYTIVPTNASYFDIGFLTISPGYYDYVDYYLWLLFVKILTIGILSIWFVTCKHLWKYILLFPIFLEIHKILSIVDFANNGVNVPFSFMSLVSGILFWKIMLVFVPYTFILIFISIRMNYNNINSINREKINEEINQQLYAVSKFDYKDYKLINKELKLLKKQKLTMDKKEYLIALIRIRDRLMI
ncbi:hypothetical protein [Psychroserpens sp. S379A]|uniref:hypothetical protein n=1 Tax=Psychroserpens sp. S379A TaxID=3415137 RepID=UPI003C7A5EAE